MQKPFVHEMFQEVAQHYPSRTALMSKDRLLSYAELDGWSNSIAHHLLERGARKGSFIYLLSDNSFSLIASMIAALKIGGVFVPMDPHQPEQRLRSLAEQISPTHVLTDLTLLQT